MQKLEIRQATPEDWSALFAFIRSNYGQQASFKAWDRHRWQFLDNPHRVADGFPVWIAVTPANQVVGAIGVQPGSLQLGGKVLPAGWVVDVMIEPSYRGQGLGHLLHDALVPANPILITLTMALATRKMAEKAGAVTLGEGCQFTRFGTPTAKDIQVYLAERARRKSWAAKMVNAGGFLGIPYAIAPAARFLGARNGPPPDPNVRIEQVDQFGELGDSLWQRARAAYPAILTRDSKHLDWRFGSSVPEMHYQRFMAFRGAAGEPVGLVVLRESHACELPFGYISEIFALRDDEGALRSLLHHAVQTLKGRRAFIEGAATTPEVQAMFRRFGFVPTHRVRPTVVVSDPAVRKMVEQTEDWYFTKGDHDWDQIHPLGYS